MSTLFSFLSIPICNITDFLTWDIHPFLEGPVPKHLVSSIAKVGILHPPLVIQHKKSSYQVVNGRKRIECARLLGKSELPCAVLTQDTPAKMILTHLFEDQTVAQPLSIPEAATFLKVCQRYLAQEEAWEMLPQEYLSKKNSFHLPDILKLEDGILQKFHFGQLTEAILPELLRMTPEDRNRIVQLIDTFRLGGNKQKRLFSLCKDIVLRNSTTFSSLFEEPELIEVIEHSMMNIPQKTNRIFEILQKRCFPRSTVAKENFEAQVQKLDLPEVFTLNPSPFFERDEISLSIRFSDVEECKKILPSLKGLFNGQGKGK